MTERFSDQVALVTGAGPASAAHAAGGRALAAPADVTSGADVAGLIETVVTEYGGLHVAFNNAAVVGEPDSIADVDEDTWASLLAANLTGVWLSMKHEDRAHETARRWGNRQHRIDRCFGVACARRLRRGQGRCARRHPHRGPPEHRERHPGHRGQPRAARDLVVAPARGRATRERDTRIGPFVPIGRARPTR